MSDVATGPVLKSLERRVLGVLAEKAKTTPDAYPLSLNAIVTGCNQKSNRDPVMDVDDADVQDVLEALQEKGLVILIQSSRVDRWRHALYDAWTSDKVELAILTELLLRDPQTEGELRTRASRMEPIEDLERLRIVLKSLAERKLVVYLTPERSRGTTLTHGFHAPDEISIMRTRVSSGITAGEIAPPPARQASVAPPPSSPQRDLAAEFDQMKAELARVTAMVVQLQQALGVTPS
jgi:uncharacterized protein YceH (UPF0502 family)